MAVLAVAALIRILDPAPMQQLRLSVFDREQWLVPRQALGEASPVRIVQIDDDSIAEYGQWPWPRTLLATLIEKIAAAKPKVLAIDILFAAADRTSPPALAQYRPDLPAELRDALARLPSNDSKLADAIAKVSTVLGLELTDREAAPAAPGNTDLLAAVPHYTGAVESIREIARSAKAAGSITVEPDVDGVFRRLPLVAVRDGGLVPGFAVAALDVVAGVPPIPRLRPRAGGLDVTVADGFAPADEAGASWVYFAPQTPFYSAAQLLDNSADAADLNGRIVLLAVTNAGTDLQRTPLGLMYGIEFYAQWIDALLSGQLLARPVYAVWIEIAALLLGGLAMIWLVRLENQALAATGATITVVMLLSGEFALFRFAGLLLDGVYPTITALTTFGVMLQGSLGAARHEVRFIKSAFRHYLAPDMVDLLASHPERLQLGGETRSITLLFCDIRDFTSISESYKTNPQALTRLINQFMTPMTNLIMVNRGTIDKYMGDAIMAFWNAPLDDPDHANRACASALAMLEELDRINAHLQAEAEDRPFKKLDIGIGINSGECVIGNMGSDQRFDYSALGDAVNLASRLEGQSKTYHINIVIGESTRQAASRWAALELDLIAVKGKEEAVKIYGLLGSVELADSIEFRQLSELHNHMLACYRGQSWSEARKAIIACRSRDLRLEAFYDLYEDRIAHFEAYPPEPDWDGVFVALTK